MGWLLGMSVAYSISICRVSDIYDEHAYHKGMLAPLCV